MSTTAHDVCRTLIRLNVCGIPAITLRALIISHGHTESEAFEAMTFARRDGFAHVDALGVWRLVERKEEVIDPKYLAAVDRYLFPDQRPWYRRAIDWLRLNFSRYVGGLVLLIVVTFFALGLSAQEVPAWVIRGIAAQETAVHWHDIGQIDGKWTKGTTGAVGPWHISLDVLADLKMQSKANRIHHDPVFAESVTRLWLQHLFSVTGCWNQTCAAWRAGLGARHKPFAKAYAARVFNYGTAY